MSGTKRTGADSNTLSRSSCPMHSPPPPRHQVCDWIEPLYLYLNVRCTVFPEHGVCGCVFIVFISVHLIKGWGSFSSSNNKVNNNFMPITSLDFGRNGRILGYATSYNWNRGMSYYDQKTQIPQIYLHAVQQKEVDPNFKWMDDRHIWLCIVLYWTLYLTLYNAAHLVLSDSKCIKMASRW